MSSYATQTWVGEQGYIKDYTVTQGDVTQHQSALSITESQISDLQDYLTSADLSSYATQTWVGQNYLSAGALDGYATETWVLEQDFGGDNLSHDNGNFIDLDVDEVFFDAIGSVNDIAISSAQGIYNIIDNNNSTETGFATGNSQYFGVWSGKSTGSGDVADLRTTNAVFLVDEDGNTTVKGTLTVNGEEVGGSTDYINTATFTDGTLTLSGVGSASASVSLDGRYATSADIPDLSGYATEQWVLDQGYGTGDVNSWDHVITQDVTLNSNDKDIRFKVPTGKDHDIKFTKANGTDTFFFNVSTGDFHADGDIIAYFNSVSDEKLKENITVVENAVDKVQQLRGVEFTWKKDGEKSAGVIAQDVEKVLPQAVKEKDIMGEGEVVKTVNYDTMSALFIEAIKEQQEQIEALKAEIKALKG